MRLFIGLFLCLFAPQLVSAQIEIPKIKALYLYNFYRLGAWSDERKSPFRICVSESNIVENLKGLLRKRKESKIKVMNEVDLSNLESCNMAYLSNSQAQSFPLGDYKETLFFSETPNTEVYFFLRDNNLVFHIDYEIIKSKAFKLSSKLLRLSKDYR